MTIETLLAGAAAFLAAAAVGTEAPGAPAKEAAAPAEEAPAAAKEPAAPATNPLLAPWTGPYGGVPPFDRARPAHLKPALEAAIAEHLAEVDRIATPCLIDFLMDPRDLTFVMVSRCL